MDYLNDVSLTVHDDLQAICEAIGSDPFLLTSGLDTVTPTTHWDARFSPNTWLLFGKESAGLPAHLLAAHPSAIIQIPMRPGTRGLNLATAAGIVLYEALRHLHQNP
jgi:tRNA (cytidine/uridine-2'-O-)-methyltransferase